MNELWIVGKYISEPPEGIVWEFQGIFNSKELAIKACGEHQDFFIGPAILNKEVSLKTTVWKGSYYPNNIEILI